MENVIKYLHLITLFFFTLNKTLDEMRNLQTNFFALVKAYAKLSLIGKHKKSGIDILLSKTVWLI